MSDDFSLLPEDEEYLHAHFQEWKRVVEGSKQGIIIKDYPLPQGYKPEKSDLMLLIPSDYPIALIDMFYFNPGVERADGGAIATVADEAHFDIIWQRWSRHYEWKAGEDNIIKHIECVSRVMQSEMNRQN